MLACERYIDLKRVRDDFKCSGGWLYSALYRQLELERRKRLYPWPTKVGIDEHFFRRGKDGFRDFVTVVVEGRTGLELEAALAHIPGRENVRTVAIDMSDPYKSFARRFFPNAIIVADKFHVLRLLSPAINRHRKAITGDQRTNPSRRLLLRNGRDLDARTRWGLRTWLAEYPALRELYDAKEALAGFYRIRSFKQASRVLTESTDELRTFRATLMRWRNEVLAYFQTRATNGMTEGFKAKLVKRRAYGYKSFGREEPNPSTLVSRVHARTRRVVRRKCLVPESNQGHGDFQSPALPTELTRRTRAGNIIVLGSDVKRLRAASLEVRDRGAEELGAIAKLPEARVADADPEPGPSADSRRASASFASARTRALARRSPPTSLATRAHDMGCNVTVLEIATDFFA